MIFDGWSLPVDPATERIVGTLGEVKKRPERTPRLHRRRA
jgi:hypothetical protein